MIFLLHRVPTFIFYCYSVRHDSVDCVPLKKWYYVRGIEKTYLCNYRYLIKNIAT